MYICIIRHGETDWNVEGRFQGREDIPLNQNGLLQAEQCGLALSKGNWDMIVTSPLLRAKQTAECIAGILNISHVLLEEDFIERDLGKASGLSPDERYALYPNKDYEGMEDWDNLKNRLCKALNKHIHANPGKNILIVSHGAAIYAILSELSTHELGLSKTKLKNACLSMLEYLDDEFKIVFYNEDADKVDYF